MRSLWPWKGDTTSAASFEKTLSALAVKISKTSARNDNLRQRSRRFRVAWTLYTGFAYILAFLILTLVTGWQNWGPTEYTAICGGPLVLYGGRRALAAYYDYRISNTQGYLDSLTTEKDTTIEKLKSATKYNETLSIVEKYGSKPSTPKQPDSNKKHSKKTTPGKPVSRLPFQPPPTANIPRGPPKGIVTPQRPHSPQEEFLQRSDSPMNQHAPPITEEFAPNAHTYPPQAPPTSFLGGTMDRVLNALIGEDENLAKNRWALLCSQCGLVNGLAPPGKKYEEVGKWKCMTCGGWNGQETETAKIMREVSQIAAGSKKDEAGEFELPTGKENELKVGDVGEDSSDAESSSGPGAADEQAPARSTRSKTKGKKGKK